MMLATALNAQQAQDSRPTGDTPLTDESQLTDVSRPSPLELPKKSYAQAVEISSQRDREKKMIQTAETLGKGPVVPELTPAAAPSTAEAVSQARVRTAGRAGEETVEEGAPSVKKVEAADLRAQQQQEARKLKASAEQQGSKLQQAQKKMQEGKRKQLQNLWRFINGIDALTAEDIVGLVLVLFMMNAQLINKVSFKFDWIPELNIFETAGITCVDCLFCTSVVPMCLPGCIIILIILGILSGTSSLLNLIS